MDITVRIYTFKDKEKKKVKRTWRETIDLDEILLQHFQREYSEEYVETSVE